MSLLNKNRAFSVRDYIFISVGLLGIFWFFLTYASNEPRSLINTSIDKQSAGHKAVQHLSRLGYNTENLSAQSQYKSNQNLLDSLQAHLGRRAMIESLSDQAVSNVYPFYWETIFIRSLARGEEQVSSEADREAEFVLRINDRGRLIEFRNPSKVPPQKAIDRKALIAAFDTDSTLQLWTSLPDSSWDRILSFDLDEDYNVPSVQSEEKKKKGPHVFARDEIRRLAEYHLEQGGWKPEKLTLSDIQIQTVNSGTAAKFTFEEKEPILGQSVRLQAMVLPTGALLEMTTEYNRDPSNGGIGSRELIGLVRSVLVMLFGLSVLVIFYFRIRARAVDTNPALVVSVVAGLIIPAIIFLEEIQRLSLFGGGTQANNFVVLALQMGFTGAFASIGYFVTFAVGDSLMRQYWSDKLSVYDFIRQGMFFNKPVGETMIRSVVLAFMLCGAWTTLLFFFPDLYFEIDRGLLEYESAWPPVYVFLNCAWFSLVMILAIYSVLGAQVYGSFKNIWIPAIAMTVAFGLIAPVNQGMGPALQEITLFLIMGTVFTAIFLKWDFLTTLLSHFLFLCMLEVSTGWMVPQSPDFYVFAIYCVFLLLLVVIGTLAILKGKERQSLPAFVPEYVEELAQEQRIKQELQIAREVQQSFLPVRTPSFKDLELAAICKPAYETGGDYYDFVQLDDHRVAVTIGDVSGKGIQAAFYMTFVKGVIHSLCREIDSPAEVLKKTNHLFGENAPRGTFISLVYGIIDLEKRTFHFARAGHNPILRITSENGQVEELQPKGIGIGLTRDETFGKHIEEVELPIREDDLLVLYTDGIVEALNEGDTFYGTQRLNNVLKRNKWRSAEEILQLLSNDVRSFIGNAKQHDDMTMMVMKLKRTNKD